MNSWICGMKVTMKFILPLFSILGALFVLGGSTLRSAEKPNVIFIICDDLNDYIGALDGHPQARTPNIDRLFASGVRVTTIKPGFVDTKMTFGMKLPGALTASAEAAGEAICKAVLAGKDVVYVLWFWRYIMLIICAIPEFQFKRMKM